MSSTFKRLLIVDDDPSILRLIKKLFEKTYDLRVSKSPNEALNIIEEGFKPGVILSDQIMPHMSGAEFLHSAARYVPSAVKVIMTGHTETTEIISCVNEAKAHLYITKPFNTIEMVQAVKISFEHHKSVYQNLNSGAVTQGLANKQVELQKTIEGLRNKLKNVKDEMVRGYQLLSLSHDRLSYIDHTEFVVELVKAMLTQIEMKSDVANMVINAAKIHNAYRCCIPEHLSIKKPMDISSKSELELWIKGFKNYIDSLRCSGLLDKTSVLLEGMFENKLGTGMPHQIDSAQFHADAQVLSIANRYAMDVYGLLPFDYEHTDREGPWEQTKSETAERHSKAMELFEAKSGWYDKKVLDALKSVLSEEYDNPKLAIKTQTLRIE